MSNRGVGGRIDMSRGSRVLAGANFGSSGQGSAPQLGIVHLDRAPDLRQIDSKNRSNKASSTLP
eukprot:6194410-Pleurochrysis_carterae.AAC.1